MAVGRHIAPFEVSNIDLSMFSAVDMANLTVDTRCSLRVGLHDVAEARERSVSVVVVC